MTLEELDHNLPNGFHDAEIFSFELDYAAGTARFRMNLLVGWPDDPEPDRHDLLRQTRRRDNNNAQRRRHARSYPSRCPVFRT